MTNKNEDYKMPWGLWQSLLVTIFAFIASSIIAFLIYTLIEPMNLGDTNLNFIAYFVNTLVILIIALIFVYYKDVSLKKFFKLPKLNALLYIPLYFLIYFLLAFVANLFFMLLPGYDANQQQPIPFKPKANYELILIFISLVVFPAIGEEVLFRGILYTGLKNKIKKFWAAILTSALFGFAHLQWNVGVDTLILSLVIIYAMEKHKSIWMGIWLHAIKNSFAFLALFVFKL